MSVVIDAWMQKNIWTDKQIDQWKRILLTTRKNEADIMEGGYIYIGQFVHILGKDVFA